MNAALQQPQDWHNADIKAALEKRGYSLERIGRELGYARGVHRVLRPGVKWARMQEAIARVIGVRPEEIWPSRYDRRPKRSGRERRTGRDRRTQA